MQSKVYIAKITEISHEQMRSLFLSNVFLYLCVQPDPANNQEEQNKHVGEGLKSSLVLFSTDDLRLKTEVSFQFS